MLKDRSKNGFFCKANMIDLVTHLTPVHLSERQAYNCFGMSKMTVKDESNKGMYQYNVMKPPEFYEFIGRVATVKFKDIDDMALSNKIENLLDLILPAFKLERQTAFGEADASSSEDSVDYSKVDTRKTLIGDFYDEDDNSELS